MIIKRKRSIFDLLDAPIGRVNSQQNPMADVERYAYKKPAKKPKLK